MNEQAEVTSLLQEFPQLQRYSNRLNLIKQLKADAAREESLELMRDSYEAVMRLTGNLYAEIITFISEEHSRQFQAVVETCEERMGMIQELEGMLKKAYGLDVMGIDAPIKQKDKSHLKLIKKESR